MQLKDLTIDALIPRDGWIRDCPHLTMNRRLSIGVIFRYSAFVPVPVPRRALERGSGTLLGGRLEISSSAGHYRSGLALPKDPSVNELDLAPKIRGRRLNVEASKNHVACVLHVNATLCGLLATSCMYEEVQLSICAYLHTRMITCAYNERGCVSTCSSAVKIESRNHSLSSALIQGTSSKELQKFTQKAFGIE